ncbi:MAG TPA: SurA N-terminal domain-containing protein, partial [Geobacteraceae bacterium]
MLGIMRKYKQSILIKLVFGIIVLSFIGTIFLVWGRGDKGTAPSDYAARVNGQKISIEEYTKTYYRLRSVYEQLYGRSLTPEMEKQMGIKKMAIESLIDNALIAKEADKMGIKPSMDEVSNAIAAIPAFQKDGAFNFEQYQQTLKANRLTTSEFEEGQLQELKIKKARQKIKDKAAVSDDEALQAYKKQHDKVDLAYVSFSPAELKGSIKLTEQELTAYLQGHQDQFKTPEEVSLSYCLVEPAKVAAKVTVTDEEAQTYYQKNIDRYQSKGEILPFAEVKDRAKADALRAKASKAAYEMAADAINKNLKTADIKAVAASVGAKVEETALFTLPAPPAALATEADVVKRAFALKQGELGGPVETPKGIYILKVKERKAAAVPPLAQIKAQVEARAVDDKAKELAKKKAEEALTLLAKADSGLKTQETTPFGYSAKGEIPKIGTSDEIM